MWQFWKFVFLVVIYLLQKFCGLNVFDEFFDLSFNVELEEIESRCDLCLKICKIVWLLLVFLIWVVIIITVFIFYIILVIYVVFRIWKMLFRIEFELQCCQIISFFVKIIFFFILYILFIVFCMCVEVSYIMLVVILIVNFMFFGSVVGFIIMGLLFYIDVYFSYIVFGLWVIVYMLRVINKYYVQFIYLKIFVFEECEKFDEEVRIEVSIRELFSGSISERRLSFFFFFQRFKLANLFVTVDDYGVFSILLDIFFVFFY